MRQEMQIELGRQLLSALDERRTALAKTIYQNPVGDYTSAGQVELEGRRFFRESPLVMGLSGDLPQPGDFITNDLASVPILLVRRDDGQVSAFLNVCRHRGTKVAEGCGKGQKTFVCPYHGWSYGRDGRLLGITDNRAFGEIDRHSHGLRPLPVKEEHGLIWVWPSPGEASIEPDRLLGGLAPELASYGLGHYAHYETRILHRRMNWKLVVDTFLEAYHVPILHRNTIAPLINGKATVFDPHNGNLRMVVPRTTIDELRALPEDRWQLLKHIAVIYVLFPNVVLVWQGDHVETWRVYPAGNGADESAMHVSLYTPEPAVTGKAREHWTKNMDLLLRTVEQEDFPLAEAMQRGFRSGAQDHIKFGRNEPALAHYHQAVHAALGLESGRA
jgi:phenylpropionate dioxygenase-like ring-hydroxylating dioxygenase large terminal subunit